MAARPVIGEDSVPRFRAHMKLNFDKSRGQWVILAPALPEQPGDVKAAADGEGAPANEKQKSLKK
jgi:hypothetical protein